MAIAAQPTKPNRNTQTQAEFSANAEAIVEWQGDFADELNSTSSTYLLGVQGTSTTSNTIGTGSKSFTTQTGLGFVLGNNVTIANSATNYMVGAVSSYDSGTGALVVNVTDTGGSGTLASWTISLAAVGANDAASVAFTPAGNISSTDVQAAIEELDSEKLSSSAGAVTGTNLEDIITGGTVGGIASIPVVTYDANGRVTSTSTATKITNKTAQATTSGTSIDFTAIPSTAKKINIMFQDVSVSGTSNPLIQVGTGGSPDTSGYSGSGSILTSTTAATNYSAGFGIRSAAAANTINGVITLMLLNASSNLWVAFGVLGMGNTANTVIVGGSITVSGALDMVRITTVNGTDTFDNGSINVSYE